LVAIPFYIGSPFLIQAPFCGRKGAVAGAFLIGGVCLLLSIVTRNKVVSGIIYYASNGALSLAFGGIYVWASELFPTNIRTLSMSIQSVFGRFGSILAPFVVDMGRRNPSLALVIFAVPCIVTGVLDLCLPETLGRVLPDTIEDIDDDIENSDSHSESSDEEVAD